MKKLFSLTIIAISLLTSCSTSYQTTSYTGQKVYSFKKNGIQYKVVDTYTRQIITDTLIKK
jgi:hypothetical protein